MDLLCECKKPPVYPPLASRRKRTLGLELGHSDCWSGEDAQITALKLAAQCFILQIVTSLTQGKPLRVLPHASIVLICIRIS